VDVDETVVDETVELLLVVDDELDCMAEIFCLMKDNACWPYSWP
jgi:hypothetical protein